jgi:ATP-dependent DNA helicase DinG
MMTEALSRLLVPGTPSEVCAVYASLADKARDAVFGFEDEVAIVDIETTGFDPDRDHIIEIAGAILRGPEVVERFATLVDPGCRIPGETTKLTGITDETVNGAPIAEVAAARLAEFIGRRGIVAHNASFDRSFLVRTGGLTAFAGPWLDSLQLARIAFPRLRSHRLRDLADAFGASTPSHRAADDVEALAHLWRVMLCGLDALPAALVHHIAALAPDSAWPLRAVLAHHAGGRRAGAFDARELRRTLVSAQRAEQFDDADDVACTCPPADRLAAEFAAGGIASRMYPGFEERAEQTRMAEAVLGAFGTRTHVAIEAGTGVGKSVAYLLPAALFAIENRVPVGVVTKTNSLTDQLVYHELPKLADTLDDDLSFVSLKGYDHYLCLRKLERFSGELQDADEETIATVSALVAWVAQSQWGDLDGINLHWRRDLRAAVQATRADCTRKRCRFFPNLCYLHGARRRAASAHIVVTNHALLFCDVVASGGILPPIRYWIVDEAHAAEAEARDQLTLGTSHAELAAVLGALHSARGGALDSLRRATRTHADATALLGVIARMEETVVRAATLSDSLFDFVKDLAALGPETGYDSLELRLTPEVRDSGPWGTIAGVARNLEKRLEVLLADGRELVTLLEAEDPGVVEVRADLIGLLSRLAEQQAGLVAVLDGESDEFVYSAAIDRRTA